MEYGHKVHVESSGVVYSRYFGAPSVDLKSLVTRSEYKSYTSGLKNWFLVNRPNHVMFLKLLPSYDQICRAFETNAKMLSTVCIVVGRSDQGEGPVVAFTILDANNVTKDPWNNSIFDIFGTSIFPIPLPPCLPSYLGEVMELLPSSFLCNYLPMYPEDFGYVEDIAYGFFLPNTFAQYEESLPKKYRKEMSRLLSKNSNLSVELVKNIAGFPATLQSMPEDLQALFHKGWAENMQRWVQERESISSISHLNNMIDPWNACGEAVIYVIKDETGKPLLINYGVTEVTYGNSRGHGDQYVYTDVVAVPLVSQEEYRERGLGMYVVYQIIRELIHNTLGRPTSESVYYHLDTSGDYKRKFVPEGSQPMLVPRDFTVLRPETINSSICRIDEFRVPAYITGFGFATDQEQLDKYKGKLIESLDVIDCPVSLFLDSYSYTFKEEESQGERFNYLHLLAESLDSGDAPKILAIQSCYSLIQSFVTYSVYESNGEKHAYVEYVYTKPTARGLGLAGKIIEHMKTNLGLKSISLHTSVLNPAKSLYDRSGFSSIVQHGYYGVGGKDEPGQQFGSSDAFYFTWTDK